MRDKDQHKLWESYTQLNEIGGGGFSGQGSPEQASWLGAETSDRVTEDDINGRLREVSSQINTLDKWIDNARATDHFDDTHGGYNLEEVFDDLDKLGQAINRFVITYDVESVHGDEIGRDDDYRGEDDDYRGETDQEKYGYPGDR